MLNKISLGRKKKIIVFKKQSKCNYTTLPPKPDNDSYDITEELLFNEIENNDEEFFDYLSQLNDNFNSEYRDLLYLLSVMSIQRCFLTKEKDIAEAQRRGKIEQAIFLLHLYKHNKIQIFPGWFTKRLRAKRRTYFFTKLQITLKFWVLQQLRKLLAITTYKTTLYAQKLQTKLNEKLPPFKASATKTFMKYW